MDSVELVITGPESFTEALAYRLRCRTTLGVLTQLVAEAERRVVISAPFMQAGYGLSAGPICEALRFALARGVSVDVISSGKSLSNVSADFKHALGAFRTFRPHANIADEKFIGSHAKFCVADGRAAYIGSANLTGRGLSGQVELGVLVRGEPAAQIEEFCDYCIKVDLFVETGSFCQIPN